MYVIDEDRAPLPDRIGRNRALLGPNVDSGKTLCQLAIRVLPDQLIAGITAPEINSRDLKKLPGAGTEQLDQRGRVRAFTRLGGKPQQKPLKGFIRARGESDHGMSAQAHVRDGTRSAGSGEKWFAIHK